METSSTVLIVDDEALGRDTLEALLINEGYRLAFAENGTQALAQIQALKPDIVLLDVMMPDLDGFEVCRQVRASPILAEIPILMVTALDDRSSRLRGIEAGADDFITKPFDRIELRTRVRTVTRLNRYRRLLAERARLEWIVDHATDGYLWLDGQNKILYANPQARVYLQMPEDENRAETPSFLELAHAQYRCEPEMGWVNWANGQIDERQELFLIRPETPTATAFWLRLTLQRSPFGADGYCLVRLQNVTAEMIDWFDMRSFHEALRHKIRTPFTGILGSLELLAKKGETLPIEAVVPLVQMALESARRLYNDFADILNYLNVHSLVEAGGHFQLSRFKELVAEIATAFPNASIEIDCPSTLQHIGLALTRQAVELILWELIENAVKFHPEHKPAVQIRVFQRDPHHIGLHVIDNGIHISPEHLPYLGQPYYQGEKYFTGETKGMGLGLATVTGLVWNVGGTCRIQNREDAIGVRVELTLPIHPDITEMLAPPGQGPQ